MQVPLRTFSDNKLTDDSPLTSVCLDPHLKLLTYDYEIQVRIDLAGGFWDNAGPASQPEALKALKAQWVISFGTNYPS